MNNINTLKNNVLNGKAITKDEALWLYNQSLQELCSAADEIRKKYYGNSFDICTIINGKCGKCSEDCKYCAQSSKYKTNIKEYGLLDSSEIVRQAKHDDESGVLRFSIVTSGRKLNDDEVDKVCESIRRIKRETNISVCVSFGLLSYEQFLKIKDEGAERVHCNLESSEKYFKSVCTTHTYDEKINTLKAARKAGLSICSGGIMGLGETVEDRIEMALTLKKLKVKSIPINFLNPIKGTPYENNIPLSDEEKLRIIAIYRFINNDAVIRLAGGRGLIEDKGEGCFKAGANAAISGDMLTTSGITVETDMKLLKKLGYKVEMINE